jgi:RNA polymerase sigma-70 factor (ECF subfamily)
MYDNRTTIGGGKYNFQTTLWTKIHEAGTSNEERQRLIINDLLYRYWKPVYCYLRRKGYDNEKAKDLTQGFFCEIVLGRSLFGQADKKRGKFRTFLLTALDRYTVDVHREETAGKRHPKNQLLTLEDYDLPGMLDVSPEEGFYYAWVSDLVDKVLSQTRQECQNTGKLVYWEVFCARVLEPILNDTKPTPLPELCRKYGLENESKASNMQVTVKRRLRKNLEQQLKQMGQSDSEMAEEISELLRIWAE